MTLAAIALCGNSAELDAGGFRSPEACARARGSEWAPHLVRMASSRGIAVLSGGEAMRAVRGCRLAPESVAVIQEEANGNGAELVRMGAVAAINLCMESPLYSPHWYDARHESARAFRHKLWYEGGTERVRFPSFDADTDDPVPWGARSRLVAAVVAAKHYSGLPADWQQSRSFRDALGLQLQDARLDAFRAFRARDALTLAGHGWQPGVAFPAPDKGALLRRHRFALVIENVAWPGYLTEKLLDTIAAGCVPIYRGAPNIENMVPRDAMVRWHENEPAPDLATRVLAMDHGEAVRIVDAGRAWLCSPDGLRYSWQGFALDVIGKVMG